MRHLKKEFLFIVCTLLLMGEFLSFGYGTSLIMSGYHALDLAQDVSRLTLMLGGNTSQIQECNLGGHCYSLEKTYLDGALGMFKAIEFSICMAILFTATLCLLINLGLEGKNERL